MFAYQRGGVPMIRSDHVANIIALLVAYCWLKWRDQESRHLHARRQLAGVVLAIGASSTFLFHYNEEYKTLVAASKTYVAVRSFIGMCMSYQYSILSPRMFVYAFQTITIVGFFFVPGSCFEMGQPYAWAWVSFGHLLGDAAAVAVLRRQRKKCFNSDFLKAGEESEV